MSDEPRKVKILLELDLYGRGYQGAAEREALQSIQWIVSKHSKHIGMHNYVLEVRTDDPMPPVVTKIKVLSEGDEAAINRSDKMVLKTWQFSALNEVERLLQQAPNVRAKDLLALVDDLQRAMACARRVDEAGATAMLKHAARLASLEKM